MANTGGLGICGHVSKDSTRTPNSRREDMAGMKEFANLFYREGALDPKTAQLVALSAMAAAGCTS